MATAWHGRCWRKIANEVHIAHIAFAAQVTHFQIISTNVMPLNRMTVLWDDDKSKKAFEEAAAEVRTVAAGNLHRDNIRTETFTDLLVQHLKQKLASQAAVLPA